MLPIINSGYKLSKAMLKESDPAAYQLLSLLPKYKANGAASICAFFLTIKAIIYFPGKTVEQKRLELSKFQEDWLSALLAGYSADPFLASLTETFRGYGLDVELARKYIHIVDAEIQSIEQGIRLSNFAELDQWMNLKGGSTAKLLVQILGYTHEDAFLYAEKLASSYQLGCILTNMTKDFLYEDRLFIPASVLEKFGVTEEELTRGSFTSQISKMTRALARKAYDQLDEARHGTSLFPSDSRKAYKAALALTGALLEKSEKNHNNPFIPTGLNAWDAKKIVWKLKLGI